MISRAPRSGRSFPRRNFGNRIRAMPQFSHTLDASLDDRPAAG